MKYSLLVSSLVPCFTVISAHTIFQELYVNGVDQGHMVGIRAPDYDGVRPNIALAVSNRYELNPPANNGCHLQ
jgi:hypothetical protein